MSDSKRWYVPLTRDLVWEFGCIATSVKSIADEYWPGCYVSVADEDSANRIIATLRSFA